METIKELLYFCNASVIYDYKELDNFDEISQAQKCIINNFHETIPVERILITLSIIDDVILKINWIDFMI